MWYGVGQEMTHIFAIGFYEGFQMGGEHMVAIECGAHKAGGTKVERLSYTPMPMQQYYDTDLCRC